MKTLRILSTFATIFSCCAGVMAQSFSEQDVVYLYDSATPGYLGLNEDYLFSNISEALPQDYQLIPVEMSEIDEEGLRTLSSCKLIVVSDTGNDRTTDDPVVKRLGELVDVCPMLCLNADFAERFTLSGFYGDCQFEIQHEVANPVILIHDSEQQRALFDDVLSASDGTVSLYLPGTESWVNAARDERHGVPGPGNFYNYAEITEPQLFECSLMLSSESENFFFLGLAQPLMDRLSAAGKNLVRNVVRYMFDKQIFSTKPHLSSIKVNGQPTSPDFMAELSSGQAHLEVSCGTNKYISLEVETVCHDCVYTSRWHTDYLKNQAYIEYWYGDNYDLYTIDIEFVSVINAINDIVDDAAPAHSSKAFVDGRFIISQGSHQYNAFGQEIK